MSSTQGGFALPATRGEAVVNQLRMEIMEGILAPGDPIRDAEIAARLGVSITPVRESIAILISEGLIDVLPNKRRQVTQLTERQAEELMDALGAMLYIGLVRIDAAQDLEPLKAIMRRVGTGIAHPEHGPIGQGPVSQMLTEVFRLAGNSELQVLSRSLQARSSARILLYPYSHFAPLWEEAFNRVADLLPDTQAAAQRVADFFTEFVAAMSAERGPDEIISPA